MPRASTGSSPSPTFLRPDFGNDYGCRITTGDFPRTDVPLRPRHRREGKVLYTEQVPEMTNEPDYKSAIAAL